jgi:hypothetical protein
MAGSCVRGIERSSSIKGGEFDRLSDYQLFQEVLFLREIILID